MIRLTQPTLRQSFAMLIDVRRPQRDQKMFADHNEIGTFFGDAGQVTTRSEHFRRPQRDRNVLGRRGPNHNEIGTFSPTTTRLEHFPATWAKPQRDRNIFADHNGIGTFFGDAGQTTTSPQPFHRPQRVHNVLMSILPALCRGGVGGSTGLKPATQVLNNKSVTIIE